MIYLIATADELELPLATAGSINELAKICGVKPGRIADIMCRNYKTKIFNGVPARIYKFMEDEP